MEKGFTVEGYLTIKAKKDYRGYSGSIRSVTKGKPALNSNEIAFLVKINVPVAFFERLTPVFEINLPSDAVVNPDVESVIKLSALEIADKLKLEVVDVGDGLRDLIDRKIKKEQENK